MTTAIAPRRFAPVEPPARAPQLTPKIQGRNRKFEPSPWIGCPTCGVVTLETNLGGAVVQLLDTASGIFDGARCKAHARTLEERDAESRYALQLALYRLGVIDDTAQGTE